MFRTHAPVVALMLALLATTPLITSADQADGPAANSSEPVSVTIDPSLTPAAPAEPESNEQLPAAADATATPSADDEATAYTPPAHEAMPLGMPIDSDPATEARATDDNDVPQAESGSWTSSLDPRENEFVRVVGALAIVLLLLIGMRLLLKRNPHLLTSGGRPSGVVEILARYPVGKGQQMVLIKLARRVLLVHHAGTSMSTLAEVEDPDEVASLLGRIEAGSRSQDAPRFRAMLDEFEQSHAATKRARRLPPGRSRVVDSGVVDLTRSQAGGMSSVLKRLGMSN